MQNISEIKKILIKAGCKLTPCTDKDILLIESTYKLKLPLVYKDFLLTMGRGAGKFMRGSSVFFDVLFSLNKWGGELLEEHGLEPLPPNAFVFWLHQGYQMAFFRIGESEVLPIYYFGEEESLKGIKLKFNSFIDFLMEELKMSDII
ncbi:SMI1-KNR4 cell-wall [Chitinophaga sp. CF118]|uniref:SMI1/KNR4 family protein n=1 Tax=Chitinophaga sp. CF118 TaxID=1884367 RepID=UPI0008E9A50F|nr:SMI1/KNR4 family protein [Chitinophaga sp. CF118]SFE91162.1 SMI1-KNR4 cell-wall [Chitinophaga sp. CF118]